MMLERNGVCVSYREDDCAIDVIYGGNTQIAAPREAIPVLTMWSPTRLALPLRPT